MSEKSMLDARLAEIDRRLRRIQSGLEPVVQAAEPAPAPPERPEAHDLPEPHDRPEPHHLPEPGADAAPGSQAPVIPPDAAPVPKRLSAQDRQVGDLVARLTALVEAQERLLASTRELTDRGDPAVGPPSLSVSAGPFAGTDALRRFERSLQALPEVRSVTVCEYQGADRAIVEVHLFEPNT